MSKADTATKRVSHAPLPPPDREDERIPDLQELVTRPADRLKIGRMIDQSAAYGAEISKFTKLKKTITVSLKDALGKYKISKCIYGDLRVNYFNSPRTYIDRATLLELGVPVDTIMAATKQRDSYTLRVSTVSKGEEEEEES